MKIEMSDATAFGCKSDADEFFLVYICPGRKEENQRNVSEMFLTSWKIIVAFYARQFVLNLVFLTIETSIVSENRSLQGPKLNLKDKSWR